MFCHISISLSTLKSLWNFFSIESLMTIGGLSSEQNRRLCCFLTMSSRQLRKRAFLSTMEWGPSFSWLLTWSSSGALVWPPSLPTHGASHNLYLCVSSVSLNIVSRS